MSCTPWRSSSNTARARGAKLRPCTATFSSSRRWVVALFDGNWNTVDGSGTAVGALHRGWVNLKASLNSDDDLMLLEECERGEDHAKAAYSKAMATTLTPTVQTLLKRQWDGTVVHHDRIRDLRNRGRAAAAAN